MKKITILTVLTMTGLLLTASILSADDKNKKENEDAKTEEVSEAARKAAEEARLREEEKKREEEGRKRLIRAYRKEFAFLENEREALKKRLDDLEKQHTSRAEKLEAEIEKYQKALLANQDTITKKEEELFSLQEKNASIEEVAETAHATLSQAELTLEKYDIMLPKNDTDKEKSKADNVGDDYIFTMIDFIFDKGIHELRELGTIRTTEGKFFLSDGSVTRGQLVAIGDIGRLGVSGEASGSLAPAGNGQLKIWNEKDATEAKTLANDPTHPTLPFYLYKSLEKEVQVEKEKTVMELIESGGKIAWVIVGLGFLGLFFLLLRVFILWWSATNTNRLVRKISDPVKKKETEKALKMCQKSRGCASKVLESALRHLDADNAQLEDVIAESILHQAPRLDRFEPSIRVFAAVAPLLGLLGTVTGMISTFDVITVYGTGDPKLLSGGISEALITTQLGLTVAIPLLILGSLLSGWSEGIKNGMEHAALRVTNMSKGFAPPE